MCVAIPLGHDPEEPDREKASASSRLYGVWMIVQISLVKLNLEVFGAAGAIWGFAEAVGLRTPNTLYFWRPASLAVGAVFFLRWCWHLALVTGLVREAQEQPTTARRRVWMVSQLFLAKLVLEVLGAAGAIWGFSEIVTLRRPDTIYIWRPVSLTVGAIFFLRWCRLLSLGAGCVQEVPTSSKKAAKKARRIWMLSQSFLAKLVLEVFGAAGAIWGFAEIVTLRTPDTVYIWQPVALTVGSIFLLRWCWQLRLLSGSESEVPTEETPMLETAHSVDSVDSDDDLKLYVEVDTDQSTCAS